VRAARNRAEFADDDAAAGAVAGAASVASVAPTTFASAANAAAAPNAAAARNVAAAPSAAAAPNLAQHWTRRQPLLVLPSRQRQLRRALLGVLNRTSARWAALPRPLRRAAFTRRRCASRLRALSTWPAWRPPRSACCRRGCIAERADCCTNAHRCGGGHSQHLRAGCWVGARARFPSGLLSVFGCPRSAAANWALHGGQRTSVARAVLIFNVSATLGSIQSFHVEFRILLESSRTDR